VEHNGVQWLSVFPSSHEGGMLWSAGRDRALAKVSIFTPSLHGVLSRVSVAALFHFALGLLVELLKYELAYCRPKLR